MLLLLVLAAVVVAGFTWWSRRPLRVGDVQLWAAAYGLTLTSANQPVVLRYLTRSQRWRRMAVLVGYLLLPSVLASFAIQLDVSAFFGVVTSLVAPGASRVAAGDGIAARFEWVGTGALALSFAGFVAVAVVRPLRPVAPPPRPVGPPPPVGAPLPGPAPVEVGS